STRVELLSIALLKLNYIFKPAASRSHCAKRPFCKKTAIFSRVFTKYRCVTPKRFYIVLLSVCTALTVKINFFTRLFHSKC
uniref:Uncharacterized protein n=1 Tax=Ciona savignyi TaxID=51511 RepID=H2ZI89_CIOSA